VAVIERCYVVRDLGPCRGIRCGCSPGGLTTMILSAQLPGICQGVKDIGATNYPDAVALWDQTGNFIGTALPRMERGKAFSIMLGRLQQELREAAYGAENARKVMQAMLRSACRAFRWRRGSCFSPPDFGRPFTRWPPSLFQRFSIFPGRWCYASPAAR
jgi:hypothetical protein